MIKIMVRKFYSSVTNNKRLKHTLGVFILGFVLTVLSYYLPPIFSPKRDIYSGGVGYVAVIVTISYGSPWSYYATFYIDRSTAPGPQYYLDHPEESASENKIYLKTNFYNKRFMIFSFIADFAVWLVFTLLILFGIRLIHESKAEATK